MKATTLLLPILLLALSVKEQVSAHVGAGMPVHHHLQPRVGKTTDRNRHVDIHRRSLPHENAQRREYLHDSINHNIKRALAKDGGATLVKRQGSGDFGPSTSSSGSGTSEHGTTESSAASLNDPVAECVPYTLPMVAEIKSQFPTTWTLADINEDDTEMMSVLQTINSSGLIPTDIGVRGTQPASLNGTALAGNYPLGSDPDCWWTDNMCTTPKHPGLLADITSCAEPYTWGYTFDDGPNCTHNALYDMWAANNQKASLMYIGSNVLDWPLEAQRGIVDGHHICVHTWSHRYMTALTTNQAFAELWYTMKAIKYVMGVTPTCWRPPYGDVDDRIRAIAQGLGLRTIMWDVDTNDWNVEPYGTIPTASLQQTYSSINSMATMAAAATGGIIVLEHELESSAMNMSIEQYPAVKAAWKHVVPLTACLNITKPYAEDITYPDFNEYISGNEMASGLPKDDMAISSTASIVPQATLSYRSTYTTSTASMATGGGSSMAASSTGAASTSSASFQKFSSSAISTFGGVAFLPTVLVSGAVMAGAGLMFL